MDGSSASSKPRYHVIVRAGILPVGESGMLKNDDDDGNLTHLGSFAYSRGAWQPHFHHQPWCAHTHKRTSPQQLVFLEKPSLSQFALPNTCSLGYFSRQKLVWRKTCGMGWMQHNNWNSNNETEELCSGATYCWSNACSSACACSPCERRQLPLFEPGRDSRDQYKPSKQRKIFATSLSETGANKTLNQNRINTVPRGRPWCDAGPGTWLNAEFHGA